MPLFARNFQELVSDSIEELSANTNLTRLSAGGKARAIVESVNKRLEETYDIFDINMARAFVSSAPGQFLELIGALVGLSRLGASAASVDENIEIIKFYVDSGTFGDINGGNDITLTVGTLLSSRPSNAGVVYRVIGNTVLPAGSSSSFISAEALAPGEESNVGTGALIYHDFTEYTDQLNKTLKVKNIHPIANGKNFESDANYRFRITNRVIEAEGANEIAIRLAILSTPGVSDVLLIPRYRGIGTFGAIIQSVTPTVSESLLDNVRARVASVMSYGDISFIRGPKETGLTMKLTVHYKSNLSEDDLVEIEEALEDAIKSLVNDLDIGEYFEVNPLIADLFGVDDRISNFGESGKPIDEIYIHRETLTGDGKIRTKLLQDYFPEEDERVIIEPSVQVPISFERKFTRR